MSAKTYSYRVNLGDEGLKKNELIYGASVVV
jgi:hypothetical protein